jgi:hypothetical protein
MPSSQPKAKWKMPNLLWTVPRSLWNVLEMNLGNWWRTIWCPLGRWRLVPKRRKLLKKVMPGSKSSVRRSRVARVRSGLSRKSFIARLTNRTKNNDIVSCSHVNLKH